MDRLRSRQRRARQELRSLGRETGQSDLYVPEPLEDDAISAGLNRASSDQAQVALLEEAGYKAAATGLFTRYSP
jgi:hypothetical protein